MLITVLPLFVKSLTLVSCDYNTVLKGVNFCVVCKRGMSVKLKCLFSKQPAAMTLLLIYKESQPDLHSFWGNLFSSLPQEGCLIPIATWLPTRPVQFFKITDLTATWALQMSWYCWEIIGFLIFHAFSLGNTTTWPWKKYRILDKNLQCAVHSEFPI